MRLELAVGWCRGCLADGESGGRDVVIEDVFGSWGVDHRSRDEYIYTLWISSRSGMCYAGFLSSFQTHQSLLPYYILYNYSCYSMLRPTRRSSIALLTKRFQVT